ncbi:hypothetical protein [Shewanella salipaludis]|uniref:DUF3352 domain-containing protein n=1 Tax=Shewanella salipaludis TaxID=2723052 RepID=A0A972JMR3_9GAMM|nr:hypothetical protein [Shewanella salipaludis]NMH65391.1 hypothetical protein [Shewanella salipaludis]
MKKFLLVAALILAGAMAYWFHQASTPRLVKANAVLEWVPADTLVFSGLLNPFPLKLYLQTVADNYPGGVAHGRLQAQADEPMAAFLLSIFDTYLRGLKDPAALLARFGLADTLKAYVYTLGASPVIKLELARPEAFWALLDQAERDTGVTHTQGQLVGIGYRSYLLADGAGTGPLSLVFAEYQGMLTITVLPLSRDTELLETALGLKRPVESLASSGMLEEIIDTHGFSGDSVSFINHVALAKALTSEDADPLARQLSRRIYGLLSAGVGELQTPECRRELMTLASHWPRTLIGLNEMRIDEQHSHIEATMVIESRNRIILTALQRLRGFIPAYVGEASLFGMGLGIDVDEFPPAVKAIWSELQTPAYQCAPLARLQAGLSARDPVILGMFTGLAESVKGVSLALLDYRLDEQQAEPVITAIDGLLSLAADKPTALFDTVKIFVPGLAEMQLVDGAEAIDLSTRLRLPARFGIKPMLALRGQHLVIYVGDRAKVLADSLAEVPVAANGLFSILADYPRLFGPLLTLAEMAVEPLPEEFAVLQGYKMRQQIHLDVNDKGVVLTSVVDSEARARD